MANGLKYGTKSIGALKFDEPIVNTVLVPITISSSEYNFLTDWVVNSEQPVGGIEVTAHTIKIKKFKPNTWIIKSAYNDVSTESGFLNKFYGKQWTFTNLTENNSILSSGDSTDASNWAHYPSNYNVIGFVLTPIKNDNTLANAAGALNWPIVEGCFKDVAGAVQYGFPNNGTKTLYVCSWYFENVDQATPSTLYSCSNGYNDQMALAIYSSADTDNEGNINIQTYDSLADPTTIEGFRATLGTAQVYSKPKTYANIIQAYDFESTEHNTFTKTVWGKTISILSTWQNQSTAFVVDERAYSGIYNHIRLPEITDLSNLISSSYPVKFWASFQQDGVHPTIWNSVKNAFANTAITDGNFAQCLFANSNTNEPLDLILNFNLASNNHYINIMDIFADSKVASSVHFNITTGTLKSLHEAFIGSQNLSEVTFNKIVNISDFSGTFEGSTLQLFPQQVACVGDWKNAGAGSPSEPTCLINFVADNARLTSFGIYKDTSGATEDAKYYKAVLDPYCVGAFARSDIEEIKYLLDMKFVVPLNGSINYDGTIFNSVFGADSKLITAAIKNLNKGDWTFDGVETNRACAGNLINLDANSINYMLSNLFDLNQNNPAKPEYDGVHFEAAHNSLNGWTVGSGSVGTHRPVILETWGNCTLTQTATAAGSMAVNLTLINCKLYVNNVEYTSNATTLPIVAGANTISIVKTDPNEDMTAVLQLTDPFKAELTPNLYSANIYLPANAGSKISSAALQEANDRGWTVYVGGTVYTG